MQMLENIGPSGYFFRPEDRFSERDLDVFKLIYDIMDKEIANNIEFKLQGYYEKCV